MCSFLFQQTWKGSFTRTEDATEKPDKWEQYTSPASLRGWPKKITGMTQIATWIHTRRNGPSAIERPTSSKGNGHEFEIATVKVPRLV